MSAKRALEGQVALVTGSVRRIGKAMAMSLAEDGATVIIHALRSRDEAHATANEIRAKGGKALVHLADITDEAQVNDMARKILDETGRIDILVNNAAIRGESAFLDMSLAQWRNVTSNILDGAFLCAKAVLPAMVAQNYGRIVNIGGVSAHLGTAARAHVVAAKTGLVGLTRALASEFAGHGITVNCIVPGKIGGERSHTSGKGIAGAPPVGREGIPADVAGIIHNICLPASGYITGQTIHVSGGLYMP